MRALVRIPLILIAVMSCGPLLPVAQSATADWPQFRGPNRDGAVTAFEEPASWPERLRRHWRVIVGEGHATPILVNDRIYAFSRQGGEEVIQALDAGTGSVVWRTAYAAPVTVNPAARAHGPGPKSTPTFADGRLFAVGMGGILTALDAGSGRMLWQRPAGEAVPLYGTATSPLVDGDRVVVHVGGHDRGALTAFDVRSGEPRWSWTGDGPSYASPVLAEIDGVPQIVALTQEHLVGVGADSGTLLWRQPFTTEYSQNIITPLVVGRTVIVGGYARPTTALRISRSGARWNTEEAWANERTPLYMADTVVAGDALFGLSHRNSGHYFVLDVRNGKTVWTGMPRQAENAAIVNAGNLVFALEDDGELMIGRIRPDGLEELRRYRVAESPTWAQPVVSGERLFVKDATAVAFWTIG